MLGHALLVYVATGYTVAGSPGLPFAPSPMANDWSTRDRLLPPAADAKAGGAARWPYAPGAVADAPLDVARSVPLDTPSKKDAPWALSPGGSLAARHIPAAPGALGASPPNGEADRPCGCANCISCLGGFAPLLFVAFVYIVLAIADSTRARSPGEPAAAPPRKCDPLLA